METDEPPASKRTDAWVALGLTFLVLVTFYFSTRAVQHHFDYTTRIASALLHGRIGLQSPPPPWLNEMVPADGSFYSVFPLGAVLSVIPVALLQQAGWIHDFPGRGLGALIAALSTFFFFQLSRLEVRSMPRRILLALFPIFGTWVWCNLGFGGAWHIALGFALLGEVAALFFVLVKPRPLLAGAFVALAFGNRTELILSLPVYLCLLAFPINSGVAIGEGITRQFRRKMPMLLRFLIVPAAVGLLTAAYNFARFHSIFDFGYSHIPKVLDEPWYQHGLFSLHAIPWNIQKMLFEGFGDIPDFPYFRFFPFGCSIFLASPFLFLLFREGGTYKIACWVAIGLLTFVLWCHGNPGGWQFSYRYAIILLPWTYLIIAGNGPAKITVIEMSLFAASVVINATATYQFLWTNNIHP